MTTPGRIIGGGVDLSHLAARAKAGQNMSGTLSATSPNADTAESSAAQVSLPPVHNAGEHTIQLPASVFEVDTQTLQNAVQLSTTVPVLLLITTQQHESQTPQSAPLSQLTRKLGGQIVLGIIDAVANQQLLAPLGLQALPAALLVLGGRTEMLYQGAQSVDTLETLLPQIVALAKQQGINGRIVAPDLGDAQLSEAEAGPQLNPAHQAAFTAAEQGDYSTAIAEYEKVLARNPRDNEASAALAQIRLLNRLQGKTMQQIRETAAANPHSIDAQLAVVDLDISGGHAEDAFLRILDLFTQAQGDERAHIQKRILELFEVVGVTDPVVHAARRKLATLIY